ncbi:hypothetical protein PHYSODRAFT_250287 [Phytophthora sojae]|uniref:RING-type domain-containing protein n=1 Tax=Phytophthora sojae (strain P6497) TaxID=1094619 RepID=G4YRN3_PHYSP|nr:hypothetical protein PHYSODRAFT_250287 [Phytophthora sojae]EGZ24074.1 hypothetical protein PHYSODRAFT_250287 [Phytophthora sojae]|eukprot:XP_009519362.1 hypothetical protein PHYSODRAFT_250287 [Phytophthora sojae]
MGNATSWLTQSLCPEEQALWVAAKSGDVATLRQGLARLTPETRFHAEWRDPVYGYSPLANACSQGHLHCVQALLAYGVDCNARDSQGNTPLHIATACGKSEVVRLLLETPAVDCFAKTSTKAQTALDIARHAYRTSEGRGHKYIQCVEHIEKKLCIYSGWLYERSDNFLSIASGISSLDSWKKRYAMVLRTAARDVAEIDLFPMRPGERRPPVPRISDVFEGVAESMDFAATNQGELVAWKSFLTSLRVNAPASPITTAFGGQRIAPPQPARPAAMSAPSASPTQAALLQEQRDLERALRLSLEESRRHPRTNSAPSAPPPSDTMLETLGYSEAIVGPDGVEIVQLMPSPPPSLSSPAKNTPGQGAGAQSNDECVICFDGHQEAVCVPCGHNAVCMDCAQELLDTTRLCPVCRQQVREVIRLYRV